jgi:hypothetical protein
MNHSEDEQGVELFKRFFAVSATVTVKLFCMWSMLSLKYSTAR